MFLIVFRYKHSQVAEWKVYTAPRHVRGEIFNTLGEARLALPARWAEDIAYEYKVVQLVEV